MKKTNRVYDTLIRNNGEYIINAISYIGKGALISQVCTKNASCAYLFATYA